MFNQTDALNTLSYLLGERSVPSAETTARSDFIQSTLNEAYKAYPWRFATRTATLSVVSGIATLPTTVDISQEINAKYYNGTQDYDLVQIDQDNVPDAFDGSSEYWLTVADNSSPYLLNTKESGVSSVVLKYQEVAPTISGSVYTPYPSKNTIALGAKRYVKMSQNPDADISQDETLFQQRLSQDVAAHQVAAPRKKRGNRQSRYSHHTGDF